MKAIVLISLLVFNVVARAEMALDLEGRNALGENIKVYGEYGNETYGVIKIEKAGKETLLTKQTCRRVGDLFQCAAGGSSPLAGASYRFRTVSPSSEDCDRIASCKTGCGLRTPIELMEYGECGEVGGCQNFVLENGRWKPISIEGAILGDRVNLRWNPHSQSRVLRTLDRGTKVSVVRSYLCLELHGQFGMWVFVDVMDGKSPKQGWLFDAFIKYQPPIDSKLKAND